MRLNIHGSKQVYGVNCTETFSPVVTWITVRLILILSLIYKWRTRQVDFVLAFPQADIECPMYMGLPKGIEMKTGGKSHMLQLVKNLNGQKQAGRVWKRHLHSKLTSIGFQQSKYNKCLYFRGNTLFEVYVDNGIFTSPNDEDTTKDMSDLRSSNCNIEDQGGIEDYLGVNIMQDLTGIHLIHPHLMDQIVKDIGINSIVLLQESLYQQHQQPPCKLIQMESPYNTTLTTD